MKDFIKRYYPSVVAFQKQVNSLVEDLVSGLQVEPGERAFFGGGQFSPKAVIVETDSAIEAYVELPGVGESDFEVTATASAFHIRGKKRDYAAGEGITMVLAEFSGGSFDREFTLPAAVDENNIKASFKNGLLALSFQKTAAREKAGRRIPVSGE